MSKHMLHPFASGALDKMDEYEKKLSKPETCMTLYLDPQFKGKTNNKDNNDSLELVKTGYYNRKDAVRM